MASSNLIIIIKFIKKLIIIEILNFYIILDNAKIPSRGSVNCRRKVNVASKRAYKSKVLLLYVYQLKPFLKVI